MFSSLRMPASCSIESQSPPSRPCSWVLSSSVIGSVWPLIQMSCMISKPRSIKPPEVDYILVDCIHDVHGCCLHVQMFLCIVGCCGGRDFMGAAKRAPAHLTTEWKNTSAILSWYGSGRTALHTLLLNVISPLLASPCFRIKMAAVLWTAMAEVHLTFDLPPSTTFSSPTFISVILALFVDL